jgi:hypothetical protein
LGYADVPFGRDCAAYGCTINDIKVDQLFAKYEACGFLYPAKLARLKPVFGRIAENWERSMRAVDGRSLHRVYCYGSVESGAWASVSVWTTTNGTVHSQHLVSAGRPEASRAVLLCAQSDSYSQSEQGAQNWFRAENRYPARIFGSCTLALGPAQSCVAQHACIGIDRSRLPDADGAVRVDRATDADAPAVDRLARRLCGDVQARADEWAAGDVGLAALDRRYAAVGLRRHRSVFVATAPGMLEPIGLAVAYRGPLGLNFSFLENRCEVWIDPQLPGELQAATAAALIRRSASVYDDFELPSILVTTDAFTGRELLDRGAQPLQDYTRSAWLREGYGAWYAHVNGFYARVLAAARRAGGDQQREACP